MRRLRAFSGIAVLALVALACAPPAASPPGQATPAAAPAGGQAQAPAASVPAAAPAAPMTLIVGHFPATHTAGVYIAQERGYFAEQGLDADLTPFQSLPDAALLLNSGQMDVYAGGTGANLYNAVARGIGLKAVADKAHSEPGVKYKAFMARKDLWDSGELRTIAGLKGRPVSSLPSGGGVEYQMDKVLQTANLTTDDLDFKGLGVPEQLTALANKGVDGAFLFQPALCTAERRGLAVVIPPLLDDVAPGLQGGVINYGAAFMRDKPEAARGFMVAYVRALRDYNDAQRFGTNKDQIVDIMMKYVPGPDRAVFEECEWGRLNPDGRVDRRWIEDEMLWDVKTGLLDRVVPVDQLVDDEFVDHAVQVLGPYKPAGQ
ncbi:MAG TPA: ABC transporter substrate-binding protein [Chloroflexota bacterium]|nr:ABC transporter substrate-binding protein [Chloroflexota bacterium]